jgi:hypothetical protein
METNECIDVVVIRGSVRPGNYTGRAGAIVGHVRLNICPRIGLESMVREDADA